MNVNGSGLPSMESMDDWLLAPTEIPSSFLPLAIASIRRSAMRASAATIGLLRPTALAAARATSTSASAITTGTATIVATAERCAPSQKNEATLCLVFDDLLI